MKKLFLFLVILLTISCSNVDDVVNTTTQNPVNVYVAGQKNNQACYWKNNQETFLSDGLAAIADTICVANNNVHVLGKRYYDNWTTEYLYWKNNVFTNLSSSYSTTGQVVRKITGMDVVGDDVYIVGYTKNPLISAEIYELVYWKNGTKTVVKQNINNIVNPKIKVFNNDIYITGKENNVDGYYINSVFNETPNVNLKDFAINNNEIYTFGSYLLGNKIINLSTGLETFIGFSNDANLTNLCFENNDMYYSNGVEIFKNTTLIQTDAQPNNGITNGISYIRDFKVVNNNIYYIKNYAPLQALPFSIVGINNTNVFEIDNNEAYFESIFVVQN